MDEADSRAALAQAIKARGLSFAAVSRQIGRNAAYIQQHVRRGVPARLDERDLRAIARLLGVPLATLGADLPESVAASPDAAAPGDYVVVPPLDPAVRVPAMAFHAGFLASLAPEAPERLRAWTMAGDAMAPTLLPGDQLLVDPGDGAGALRDGLYLCGHGGARIVKRLCVHPSRRHLTMLSDNAAYPPWPEVPLAEVEIVGRIVWAGRRFS